MGSPSLGVTQGSCFWGVEVGLGSGAHKQSRKVSLALLCAPCEKGSREMILVLMIIIVELIEVFQSSGGAGELL